MHPSKRRSLILTLSLLALFSLACNLTAVVGSQPTPETPIQEGLNQDYPVNISAEAVPQYALTVAQRNKIANHGYPDRFLISFSTKTLADGERIALRQETWYYDDTGYQVVFRNGAVFTENNGAPVESAGLGSTGYQPERFTQAMDLESVLAVTGENGFFAQPMEAGLVENGQIVFLKGLSVGFQDGKLKYVETLPLGAAGE